MTRYEKHKQEKKKAIRELLFKLMAAFIKLSQEPNLNNWAAYQDIENQIMIIKSRPIMPENYNPSGIININK